MRFLAILFCSSLVLTSGCASWWKSSELEKSDTVTLQPLHIPASLSSKKIQAYYPVPAANPKAPFGDVDLIPPDARKVPVE